jgi:GNAT superfamily N-acetyltransferase
VPAVQAAAAGGVREVPVEERAYRLRQQTDCGHPESDSTSGLVAYLDGEPVGWCAVEPRTAYEGLVRNARVPWEGREEDKTDGSIWAVTCLFTRVGFRKLGVSHALARAAVDFARERGARAIEAYPMTTKDVIAEELHVGTEGVFADAGFRRGESSHTAAARDAHRLLIPCCARCAQARIAVEIWMSSNVKVTVSQRTSLAPALRPLISTFDGHADSR